jgi:hypothetical protein
MTTQEQAYITGFVKRANEYGFDNHEALELLKQAGVTLTPEKIQALLKGFTRSSGLLGSGLGAAGGGLLGGVNGLMNPDQSIDPRTGEIVKQNRLLSALSGVGKGAIGGGVVGGAAGLGLGALAKNQHSAELTKAMSVPGHAKDADVEALIRHIQSSNYVM